MGLTRSIRSLCERSCCARRQLGTGCSPDPEPLQRLVLCVPRVMSSAHVLLRDGKDPEVELRERLREVGRAVLEIAER